MVQVNPNAIFVNKRQEGNPVLKHIRNVRWQFADIVPDYQMGQNACAVFLSLRFAAQAACVSALQICCLYTEHHILPLLCSNAQLTHT